MCYAEDSVEYTTATCKMCAVAKSVYQKPRSVCPHVPAMGICQNRENHPRGANIIHYRNAEINAFNGCGYCKWAERHPDGTQRDRLNNPGWPGCCRPPSTQDYQLYIDKADWLAISSIYKLSRTASSEDGSRTSTTQQSSRESSSSSMREDQSIKSRLSPVTKPLMTWPAPRSSSPSSRTQSVRVGMDPIPRSSSPLASGNSRRERPNTPTSKDAPVPPRVSRGNSTPTYSKNSSSGSPDEPTTPPARQYNELVPTRQRIMPQSGSVTVEKSSVIVPRDTFVSNIRRYSPPVEPDASTPRRTTIAIQNQSTFYPKEDSSSSPRNRPSFRPNASPRSIDIPIVMPGVGYRDRNSTPPAVRTPIEDMVVAERSTLSSADLARVHALDCALQGLALTSSTPNNYPSSSNPLNHSTSSSSSDSSDGSVTSMGSHGYDDGGSSTAGGSSDFTDFLSDDSDYELQRQAEIRAEILQRQRLDRAEEKEFRDAQESIAAYGLNNIMALQSLTQGTVGRGSGVRQTKVQGGHSLDLPRQYHAVSIDRYR